jgi:hypothetical protein
MKKLFCLFVLGMAVTVNSNATGFPALRFNFFQPSATFDRMWVDYDITEGGLKGMRLHLKFTAYDMLNLDSYVAVYFEYNDERGGVIKDKNGKFNSTAGDVALYKSIKPLYNPAVFDDLQLFMPYSELDLDPGNYDLTMDIKLIYKEGGEITKLTFYDFEYTKPGSTPGRPSSGAMPTAKVEDLWVDYNVTENGKKGMRVHIKCRVFNMKNAECYLAVYFEKKNGDKIYGINKQYRSKSGQAAVYKSLIPGYDEAVYDDAQLFMPYDEFSLGRGRSDLKLDADVIYKNGDLLKHLKYQEFWFEQ